MTAAGIRAGFRAKVLPCAGLIVPPLLWAVNTQAGQILPYAECTASVKYAALLSFALALVALVSGHASWRTTQRNRSDAALRVSACPASFSFVGLLSGLSAAIFAFALVLQGLSSLILTGCER